MTCIVGLEHNNHVYIGGDTAATSGYDVVIRGDEKVFANGKMVMGFTSSFRMGQLLRYSFVPPRNAHAGDDMKYLATTFVDAARKLYGAKGFLKTRDNVEAAGTFLLGYNKRLYAIYDDFQVGSPVDGYAAIGAGSDLALGAVYALKSVIDDPVAIVVVALEAAAKFNASVRAPFVIYELSPRGKARRIDP